MNVLKRAKRFASRILVAGASVLFSTCLLPMPEDEFLLMKEHRIVTLNDVRSAALDSDGSVYLSARGLNSPYWDGTVLYRWTTDGGLVELYDFGSPILDVVPCNDGVFLNVNSELVYWSESGGAEYFGAYDSVCRIFRLTSHVAVCTEDYDSNNFLYLFDSTGDMVDSDTTSRYSAGVWSATADRLYVSWDDIGQDDIYYIEISESSESIGAQGFTGETLEWPIAVTADGSYLSFGDGSVYDVSDGSLTYYGTPSSDVTSPAFFSYDHAVWLGTEPGTGDPTLEVASMACYPLPCGGSREIVARYDGDVLAAAYSVSYDRLTVVSYDEYTSRVTIRSYTDAEIETMRLAAYGWY